MFEDEYWLYWIPLPSRPPVPAIAQQPATAGSDDLYIGPLLDETGRFVFGGIEETGKRQFGPLLEDGRIVFGVVGSVAAPSPPLTVEETEGLPTSLHLLEHKPRDAVFPALQVLPILWDQQEQAAGLVPPPLPPQFEEDAPPHSLGLWVPRELGRPPVRAIVLPGLAESNDQNPPLFFTVDFPYNTLTGTQPIVNLPYDTVGNVTFLVVFPYDVNPGPTVNTRFPYDAVQPTPTWTSPIRRRSQLA